MGWLQDKVQELVWGGIDLDERQKIIDKRRAYRHGDQKKQLEIRHGADDNITVNFIGLVVNRAATLLFGAGVEFDLPGEDTEPVKIFIDATWDANKKAILLNKLATLGAEDGTCYAKLLPDGIVGRDGKKYTRIVPQDPKLVEIFTKPDDIEYVEKYVIKWKGKRNGKPTNYKQEIRRSENGNTWEMETKYAAQNSTNWTSEGVITWAYDFAPLMHWQNMPDPLSPYGEPDITNDVIILQDRLNFTASNMSKIIRHHAHPKTIITGANASDVTDDPAKAIFLPTNESKAYNLEMTSDLMSSFNFLQFLRQALFSITQSIDISSFADKIGALTNFGLRVLTMDAMARLDMKRDLYGDALIEINRRLLVLSDMGTDGGDVVWPEALPVSETEVSQALQQDLNMGIVSKETVAVKRGYVWVDEQERMDNETRATDNLGQLFIKQFTKGQ